MRGNIYGVNIKLTPDNRPYLIEMNGQGSGTSGFVMVYNDLRTQRAILSAMNHFGDENQFIENLKLKILTLPLVQKEYF